MKRLLLIGVLLFSGLANAEAPFGLKTGMSLTEVKRIAGDPIKISDNYYMFTKTPKPVAGLSSYGMLITPKSGLCKVVGVGKTLNTNVYGDAIKSEFLDLKNLLTAKYGKPTRDYDFLRAGSIWKEHNDWMMGLYKEERTLTAMWGVNESNGIEDLMLNAIADSGNTGYVTITYELSNINSCSKERKSRDASGL
ncbi:hypothetical protein [Acinetobacter sp. NyZ410]|uniref:hypothetical protein n=1 Tax=Acinetobacter sp. NyZ410 TaxID=2929509 RepID=UPI001FBABCB6|nr:hypothetical protein [Acinetobacter sp. NyZ410]UOH17168.1 hypothetical protein MTO68_15230 [Acinetobacter sp. NyZ410]